MTLSEISYQGSKSRFMKVLKPLIENNLDEGMTYIEPFGGGMNSFTPINASKKIANDINEYNIALWVSLKKQGFSGIETAWSDYLNTLSSCEDKPNGPNYLQAKKLYFDMKKDCLSDGGKYPKALLGFVAYACSSCTEIMNPLKYPTILLFTATLLMQTLKNMQMILILNVFGIGAGN